MSARSHIVEALHRFPLARFEPASLCILKNYYFSTFTSDLSAGLTVGVVALPLAMAFAIASGMTPESGIYTAIIAGFLISLLGGLNYGILALININIFYILSFGSALILRLFYFLIFLSSIDLISLVFRCKYIFENK